KIADPQGKPVANAWVRVESSRSSSAVVKPWQIPLRRVAFTDAGGSVTLPRRPDEGVTVWAAAPGLLPVGQEKVRGSSVTLRLAAGTARRIEVRDAQGKPLAGVLVALADSFWVAGRTAEGGRLELPAPAAGLDLRLAAEDGRRLTYRLRAAKPEEIGPAVIALKPAVPASGKVVEDGTGRPVPGALVWPDQDLGAVTRAGKDGSFQLAHVEPEVGIHATAPGYFTDPGRAGGRVVTFHLLPRLAAGGIVVDEAGQPVVGARLKASPKEGPRAYRSAAAWGSGGFARSAASGRFRLAGLTAGVIYELRAEREGFAPSRVELPARQAGAPAPDLRVVLHPGRTAFGMVIDGRRRPVAGAEVSLRPTLPADLIARARELRNPERIPASTGASGRFEMKNLPAGTFDLTVRARGFAPITVPALAIPEGKGATDLGTVQLAPGGAVHGMVVDPQGEPIADAEVQAKGADRDGQAFRESRPGDVGAGSAVTAADGSFTLEDLAPGVALDVSVTHPGYGPGGAPGVAVPSETPIRVVLQPVARVSGHVLGPDGKPVAGASVALHESPRRLGGAFFQASSRHLHEGVTDDEGAFAFADVAPGPFQMSASAPGHQRAELRGLEVKPGQDLSGIAIQLPAGATVEGRVTSTEGKPLAEAQVIVADAAVNGMLGYSPFRGATDDGGQYRIEGIPPGPHTLEASAEGYRRAVRDVEAAAEPRKVDFQLDRGLEISGRVVDDEGTPVADAGVSLFRAGGEPQGAPTEADGTFRLSGVEDGDYVLQAVKRGYSSGPVRKVTVAGAPVSGIELKLNPSEGTITGRLTGLEFSQLARVRVWVSASFNVGAVDAEGSYRISHLAPGPWKVQATVPDTPLHAEGEVTLEPGASEARLDLNFGGGHTLSGVVLRNGEPLAGAALLLTRPGQSLRASADLQGAFRFEGLEDGTYELNAGTGGGAWHKETVEITGDQTIRVELHTASLSGRVVDATDSSPVSGARIFVKSPEGSNRSPFFSDATTDARGVFRLAEVAEGAWTVQAVKEGYAAGERKIEVGDSPPGDVEIRLDPTEGVTVEALLPTGQPPERVRVAALDGGGAAVSTGTYLTGENGRARISNVPPGSWLLLIESDQSASATVPAPVPGPAVHVVLPPAGQLRVQVPDLKGGDASVVLSGAGGVYRGFDWDGRVRSEWDLAGGSRSFDRLPAGVWQVTARAADGRSWSGTATVTPGGAAEVELR
ncbi:MAG TPA: carboxypeptidase regulatory-like domain-containing protein, partial [Thermoanaerobaculia bacterium]